MTGRSGGSGGRFVVLVGVALAAGAVGAAAQAKKSPAPAKRCLLDIVHVDRQGLRVENVRGVVNYFAGGNVHLRCQNQQVDLYADSLASFGGNVVQLIGKVHFVDSTTDMTALFGQYNKVSADEYFDAQGNVVHKDLESGSVLTGPHVIYYRPLEGKRPESEVVADRRSKVEYAVTDSAGKRQEPYLIVGDRIKLIGSDAMYAWGRVTVDRSDLKARGDSLWLDSGEKSAGRLAGHATLNGLGRDSFELRGKSIDLALANREIVGLKARDSAHAVAGQVTIEADSLRLDLANRQVERTTAWGDSLRPRALSADYEVKGDSLVIETPKQQLDAVRAYGNGWAGFTPDTAGTRRDWISGAIVVVHFVQRDSAGVTKNAVRELTATTRARSYYQMAADKPGDRPSINYTRADTIVVTMRVTADSNTVDRVAARGNVDGLHLQPALARADSTRRDSTATPPPPPPVPAARRPRP